MRWEALIGMDSSHTTSTKGQRICTPGAWCARVIKSDDWLMIASLAARDNQLHALRDSVNGGVEGAGFVGYGLAPH